MRGFFMSVGNFYPQKIYYEPQALTYALGKYLKNKYSDIEWTDIENHNNIPYFRNKSNCEFAKIKQNVIIGIRKTHKYVENHKISDYLVPYTSSGCAASCLYCYLVCNYNKCSYLRLFVNREQMLDKLIKFSKKSDNPLTFEIGSNSDLVLENVLTRHLSWTIENFAREGRGFLTFPTKFNMIEKLLPLEHKGKTIVRMSVNPEEIIRKVEFGTSTLQDRINAINDLCESGYRVGLLIAPVVMVENWKQLYCKLLEILKDNLSEKTKKRMTIEVIFMTYSYVHRMINREAFPKAIDLFDGDLMAGGGRGKYYYKKEIKDSGKDFLQSEILKKLPDSKIIYIT